MHNSMYCWHAATDRSWPSWIEPDSEVWQALSSMDEEISGTYNDMFPALTKQFPAVFPSYVSVFAFAITWASIVFTHTFSA